MATGGDCGEERATGPTGLDGGLTSAWSVLGQLLHRIARGLPLRPELPTIPPREPRREELHGLLNSFRRYTRAYFQRWLLIGALIGIVAGIGAILFASAITFCTHVLLAGIAGFFPPQPAGDQGPHALTPITHHWLIPVVTTLGGLLTGLIVFTFAPEAEGHGTDAAIESFHEKGGLIRGRIPIVKIVASAITIGSGGSAGREGPTAQISAGFGSWLGGILHLDEHDRRIAVAAGIGSGIGAIFKAPFGGALLSAEILYKRDFEADALFPSFVASVIGFTIYGAWAGWTPIFGAGGHFSFVHPVSLVGYLILGLCAGLVGLLYPKTLYGIRDLFKRVRVPTHVKPAIGGLLVGIIGLFMPQALGMGYGYVQIAISGNYVQLAAWLMFALVFVKILATSLTIGSGGSGGVFGPGMVIGGFLGGALWAGLHAVAPGVVAGTNPGAFVVVGMGAFFGGIAKAPLAVILMVVEMTGEFSLLAPAMLATMIAYLVTGDVSIYENQVPTRLDSPAHKNDYALPLLRSVTVREAMQPITTVGDVRAAPDTPVAEVTDELRGRGAAQALIVEGGKLLGILTGRAARRAAEQTGAGPLRARQVMTRETPRVYPDDPLYLAWVRLSRRGLRQLPVVSRADPTQLVGTVSLDAIGRLLRLQARSIARAEERHAPKATAAESVAAETTRSPVDPLAATCVAQVMLRSPRTVREAEPLATARRLLDERGAALLVVDAADRLVGIITRGDLRDRPDCADGREVTVGDAAVRKLVTVGPDETLAASVRKMNRLGLRQLPVVSGPQPALPLGLLRRSDVLAVFGGTSGAFSVPVSAPPSS